jgi:hypothetical protein
MATLARAAASAPWHSHSIHEVTFVSNEKNFTGRYKAYPPHQSNFGRIDAICDALTTAHRIKVRRISPGTSANSPAGAISQRRRYLIRPAPFFISASQNVSVQP